MLVAQTKRNDAKEHNRGMKQGLSRYALLVFGGAAVVFFLLVLNGIIGAPNSTVIPLWKALSPQPNRESEALLALTFSADGKQLIAGSNDGRLTVWRVSDSALLQDLKVQAQGISAVTVTPDNSTIVYGTTSWNPEKLQLQDATLALWPLGAGEAQVNWKARVNWKVSGGISQLLATHKELIVATSQTALQIRNPQTGKVLTSINYAGSTFAPLSDSHSVIGSMSGEVRKINFDSRSVVALFKLPSIKGKPGPATHQEPSPEVRELALLPDNETLIVAGRCAGDTVRLFSLKTNKEINSLPISEEIQAASLSPDAKTFATSSRSGVMLWDTATWKQKAILEATQGQHIVAIDFSPDSKVLATAGIGAKVSLWKVVP